MGGRTTNTSTVLKSHIPPKQKLSLQFGWRSRRGQRKPQCVSISCAVSSPMSVELNLGWPSNIPKDICLAERGKGPIWRTVMCSSCCTSCTSLLTPDSPAMEIAHTTTKYAFPSKKTQCPAASESASLASGQVGYRNLAPAKQMKAVL